MHILELAIDRGEADVGDLVQLIQAGHDQLPDLARVPLPVRLLHQAGLDLLGDLLEFGHAHGPLLGGLEEAAQNLVAIKGLPAAILLHHHELDLFNALVRREPPLAVQALPASPDRRPVAGLPRVDDLLLHLPAKGALHQGRSSVSRPNRSAESFDPELKTEGLTGEAVRCTRGTAGRAPGPCPAPAAGGPPRSLPR